MKLRSTMKRAYRTTWSGIVSIVAAESVAQARQPTQAEFGTQNAAEFGNRCNTRRDGGRRFLDTHDKVDDMGRQRAAAWRAGECRHGERRGRCEWCVKQTGGGMADWIRALVKIALTEHKDDVDAVADAVDNYLLVTRQVCNIKAEMNDEIESHRAKMKRLGNELAEARKNCPCPAAALTYHGDPSGNNDSYHECRICGKTH